ncbi:dipeptidase PepV [Mycoplasmatota bacterium zrk1]
MDYKNVIKQYESEMIERLQGLVRIKSVEDIATATKEMPYGVGPYKCLEYTLNLCESLGMKTVNLDGHVGWAEVGSGKEMIAVLTHLDVVPEGDAKTWSVPPYDAIIKDGKMIGRGTSDNKSPAIASIYALKSMMDMNVKFNKRIRLIFGTNEETGFGCMKHYVKHAELPTVGFTPDASFPIIHGEKGILQLEFKSRLDLGNLNVKSFEGGVATNSVPDKCEIVIQGNFKSFVDKVKEFIDTHNFDAIVEVSDVCKIITFGKSSHGSTPEEGVNAISRMFKLFAECEISSNLVNDYNSKIAECTNGELMGSDLSDEFGSLTMNVGTLELVDQEIVFGIDVRYPISKSLEQVVDKIKEGLSRSVISVDEKFHKEPIYYEKTDQLVMKLLNAYREVTNDYESEPFTIGGGSYARAMPNLIAFGACFIEDGFCAHQPNEFIYIKRLVEQAEIYCNALENLLED